MKSPTEQSHNISLNISAKWFSAHIRHWILRVPDLQAHRTNGTQMATITLKGTKTFQTTMENFAAS